MLRNLILPRLTRGFLYVIISAAALFSQSCGHQSSPEIIASEFIEKAESAVEERSSAGLRNLISKDYLDESGRDYREIIGLASAYLIRSKSIHLFIDLETAHTADDETIRCRLLAAFAATPIGSRNLLPDVNADFYWFDIVLVEEKGDWRMLSAHWQQALLEDFFNGEDSDTS